MKITINSILFLLAIALSGCATSSNPQRSACMTTYGIQSDKGIVLTGDHRLATPGTFRPPVEIIIVAKTDLTNLRIGYTADQVIFNWELDPNQLRVDGGPADGLHQPLAGRISTDKFMTIRWIVTPQHESIYVNDELRFEHAGDYSGIDKSVSVFTAAGSKVTVKSIKVKQLTSASQ